MYIYIYIYICTADKLPQIGECPVVMISAEKKVNPKPQTSKKHTPICVLILQHMCPHTAMYVSAYNYTCFRILLYVSSYHYISAGKKVTSKNAHTYIEGNR